MKTLKLFTAILFVSFLGLTSCQKEEDIENGENPNTNSANSETASNLERSSMYDGSFDDFLDGTSCSSILFPVTAIVNDTEVTLRSQLDYQLVINIIGEIINDEDDITFQFPLTIKLSNYNEVVVQNQTEFDAITNACQEAEEEQESAIRCLDIDYPMTILSYNISLEQTGSTVIKSDQELYTYMSGFGDDEKFSIKYPISATINGESEVNITSDAELKAQVKECMENDETRDEAEEDAEEMESILIEGAFRIESYVNAGVNSANDYANYSINFANDLSITAVNTVNVLAEQAEGTFSIASEMSVLFTLDFSGNTNFELLNDTWTVKSFSNSSITLESTTKSNATLVLSKI